MEVLKRQSMKAFTLIELLVVISIIILLMGITMPCLSKARDLSKKMICGARMRQISIAFNNYSLDYNDRIITATKVMDSSNPWIWALLPYIDGDSSKVKSWDSPAELWFCPSDKDPYPLGYSPHNMEYTSYALNGYYQKATAGSGWSKATPEVKIGPAGNYKYSNVRNGSGCMLMAETSYYGQIYDADNPRVSRLRLDNAGHHRNTSGFYHSGSMNLVFVDGHIDSVKGQSAECVDMPLTIKNNNYMFWSDLALPDSQQNRTLWGPGY